VNSLWTQENALPDPLIHSFELKNSVFQSDEYEKEILRLTVALFSYFIKSNIIFQLYICGQIQCSL